MDIIERLAFIKDHVGPLAANIADDAIAEIERLRALTEWRPIATAPKEIVERNDSCGFGAYILVRPFWGKIPGVVRWCEDKNGIGELATCYGTRPASTPTHWWPLPELPAAPTGDGDGSQS